MSQAIENLRNLLQKKSDFYNGFGLNKMEDSDVCISRRMASLLPVIKEPFISYSICPLEDAVNKSIRHLKVFGDSYAISAGRIVKNTKIHQIPNFNSFEFFVSVSFQADDDTGSVLENSGVVNCYKVPLHLNDLSTVLFAHEHVHALKETNFAEFIDGSIFADVLPLFLELLLLDKLPKTKADYLLISRLSALYSAYIDSDWARRSIRESEDDGELFKVLCSETLNHINSFYYSLRLYELYKEDKEGILQKIGQVLNHEKTTRVILNELGLLHVFEEDKAKQAVKSLVSRIN